MIDKLEMFLALARERHFGKAAEACNVTQPTLSAAIKQLEEHLGVMLVSRGSRFQGLTAEGERVLEWARRIVADARAMKMEVDAAKRGLSGHVRFAVIPTALAVVQEVTTSFHEKHPEVTFSVLSRSSVEILSLLENLRIDIGITYLDNEPIGRVATVPLFIERYRFVTGDAALFAGRETLTWREAALVPLCLLTPDMQNRRIIDHYLAQSGAAVKPVLESDSMMTLVSHVRAGQWSSILPAKIVEMYATQGPGLRSLPLVEPEGAHVVGAIAAARDPQTPVVEALLRHARSLPGTTQGV